MERKLTTQQTGNSHLSTILLILAKVSIILTLTTWFVCGCGFVDAVIEEEDKAQEKRIDTDGDGWPNVIDRYPYDPSRY